MDYSAKLECAFKKFDEYNARDPHTETSNGQTFPKELLYALRMSEKLDIYAPDAPTHLKLAARCQHIGRWEIPRNTFPMDRKGYLQWRTRLALYHTEISSSILLACGFDPETIEKVRFLLQKKELRQHHPETQILEDVICLVFIQYYLADFAAQHDDDKVVDILVKTMRKMSARALQEAGGIALSPTISKLIERAASEFKG
jgi:hypothetical protein